MIMRHFWIGIICLIAFSSCEKDEFLPFELTAEGIVGEWELYQFQGNTGADDYRTPYEPSGITITFLANGKLKSEKFFGCTDGEYQVADRNLTVFLDCEGEVPEKSYFLNRENADLVMHPKAPNMCIEGCSLIFKKIN